MRAVISPVGLSLTKKPTSGQILGYYREQKAALDKILTSPASDELYLVPPAHKMTLQISKLAANHFFKKGYKTHILPIKVSSGKYQGFSAALIDYVNAVSNIIEEHSGNAVINATNSFKIIAAYNHLMASLYKVDIYYLDESHGKKESVLRLPPFPLTYDVNLWKENERELEAIIKNNQTQLIRKLPNSLKALFPGGKIGPVVLSFYRAYTYNKTSELRIIVKKREIINEIQDYSRADTLVLRKVKPLHTEIIEFIKDELEKIMKPSPDDVRGDSKWRRSQSHELYKRLTNEVLHTSIIKWLAETSGGNLVLHMNKEALGLPVEKFVIKNKCINEIFAVGRAIVAPHNFDIRGEISGSTNNGKVLLIRCDPENDLKYSHTELNYLEKYFKNRNMAVKILSGEKLRRRDISNELSKADIAHFIGHTVCSDEDSMKSGWVISKKGFKNSSGRFTMENVRKLKILPRYIFANSCSSGSAAFLGGLFILNGIRNYVASLYPVPDKSAMKFSQKFYDGILRGQPAGAAMKAAGGKMYVLYGDPRNR